MDGIFNSLGDLPHSNFLNDVLNHGVPLFLIDHLADAPIGQHHYFMLKK